MKKSILRKIMLVEIILMLIFPLGICYAGNQRWSLISPGAGGWVHEIATHPTDDNILYVGSDVIPFGKSTDKGESYKMMSRGAVGITYAIASEPDNPDRIYMGGNSGFYRTETGGVNWENVPSIGPISSIAIHLSSYNIIYAGGNGTGELYKSTDYAQNWSLISTIGSDSATLYSIIIHPQNPQIMFAATDVGFYKSTDGGGNWQAKNSGLSHTKVRYAVIDPLNPDILYLTLSAEPGRDSSVYKSTDVGDSWQEKGSGISTGDCDLMEIVINPVNPNILFTHTAWPSKDRSIYRTIDGGEIWNNVKDNINYGWTVYAGLSGVNAKCMAISATGSTVYFGTDMYLYKSEDNGDNWHQIYTKEVKPGHWSNIGYDNGCAENIVVDPADPNIIYIGFWDFGLWKSTDRGGSIMQVTRPAAAPLYSDVYGIAVDPERSNIIYASFSLHGRETTGSIYKSIDYGETWEKKGDGLPDAVIWDLDIDPFSPLASRTLYATIGTRYNNNVEDAGVWKSTDGGENWFQVNNGLTPGPSRCRLTIDPNIPGKIFYSGGWWEGGYRTTDGGNNWEKILSRCQSFAVDPTDSNIVYAGTGHGIKKSKDGGGSWEIILGIPSESDYCWTMAVHPIDSKVVYAGFAGEFAGGDKKEGDGVYKSTDGGETWQPMNEGLTSLDVFNLTIPGNNPDTIYACTDAGALEYTTASITYTFFLHVGDVDGDGRVTAYDAALTVQYAIGMIALIPEQTQTADVDGDGRVTAYDASLIAQYAVGMIDKIPIE